MMDKQELADLEVLMARKDFQRFLFRAIQTAGIFAQGTNGHDGRDLAFAEGRRSLGLWLLGQADAGLPEPMQSPDHIAALHALLRAQLDTPPPPKGKGNATRIDRYDDIRTADGDE